jgi:hypothetical protein
MKYYLFLLPTLFLFSCIKEFDMLPPEVSLYSYTYLRNGDTILLPIETEMELIAKSQNKNLTYYWDFGDGKNSSQKANYHSYASKGVYPVTLKVSNGDKEGEFKFYIKVFGSIVGDKSEYSEGLWIHSQNNDSYIFTKNISRIGLDMHKLIDDTVVYTKRVENFNSDFNLIDLKTDSENNFLLWGNNWFNKIDQNATTLTKSRVSSFQKGHIFLTSDNNYQLIGQNSYGVEYEYIDYSGNSISKNKLYINENSNKKCLDAMFINENEYLMLFGYDEYDTSDFTPYTSVVKKNFENESEIELTIPYFYFNNILQADFGYFTYGIDEGNHLSIVKISPDLKIEWQQRFDLQNDYSNNYYDYGGYSDYYYNYSDYSDNNSEWDNSNKKILVIEYDDRYLLFHDKDVFIIKMGEDIRKISILKNIDFKINSVCANGQNILLLATVKNTNSDRYQGETYPFIFKMNKEGRIID